MIKRKYWIVAAIGGLCLLIVLIAYTYISQGEKRNDTKKISVIVHGNNAERWENFLQGAQQAVADLKAEITFVTMTGDVDFDEQKRLIKREIKNGAQGLIVVAVDSGQMAEVIQEGSVDVPIVMAETNVDGKGKDKLEYVSADNRKMGEKLAEIIIKDNAIDGPVYVLKEGQQRGSVVERQEGLVSVLEANGYSVVYWEPEEGDYNHALLVQKMIEQTAPGIIVALEDTAFEAVIDGTEKYILMHKDSKLRPEIYGIGSTAKIVYNLDAGFIQGIVFQDEYHVGYTSMVCLMRQMNNEVDSEEEGKIIEFYSADKETLHLPENERLLYPIIQ